MWLFGRRRTAATTGRTGASGTLMPVCGINVTHVRAGSATGAWAERLGLSSLDSSFLRVETPTAHMHVGWLSTLELPTRAEQLDPAALIEQIAGRLHVAPRFRQRVVQSPPSLAEPSWEDDGSFHIRVTCTSSTSRGRRAAGSRSSRTASYPARGQDPRPCSRTPSTNSPLRRRFVLTQEQGELGFSPSDEGLSSPGLIH
jgi:hypothetical protein